MAGASSWNLMKLQMVQVEDALLRLKRQLALQPPLLDKAIEEVQQLRPLAAQALLELTSTLSKQVDTWELIRLKPELVIYEKETKELRQEIDHLRGLITESESRKAHVQQALKRAKVRNGQLLVEMQDLREKLEIQRSSEQANDIAVSSTRINLEQEMAAARQQADQNTSTHEALAESDQERRQLSKFDSDADLAERLEETQRLLEDARDRATDAEMECDSLRKQLEDERSKPTSPKNASGNGADGNDADLAERLEETQRLLEDARDRATDAEMECDSLRKQLEEERSKPTSPKNASGNGADGNDADLAERLEETQRLLEDARDRATDLEMECELLRNTRKEEQETGKTQRELALERQIAQVTVDIDLAMRLEIAILVAAVVIQLFYSKIYDKLISTTTKGTAHLEPRTEIIEVSEFHSPACEGPPARVWLIRPPRQESGEDTPCISIRPEMKIPGKSDAATAGEQLYGRVSCATLRHEDGGFLDLCSDESCNEAGCQRLPSVGEGECGTSFLGFAAASWRCITDQLNE
eukprot:symbB.v1.2.010138.t1/scaffold618.1/size180184/15